MKYWRFCCLLAFIVQSIDEIKGVDQELIKSVDSQFGAFMDNDFLNKFVNYSLTHVAESYKLLFTHAKFSSYDYQRQGFAKMFKKLSDDTWDDAIDTLKYVTKRGGGYPTEKMGVSAALKKSIDESESLYNAFRTYKDVFFEDANIIHSIASKSGRHHDSDAVSFIENKFSGKHSEIIRDLAGHISDFNNVIIMNHEPKSKNCLALHLFDEYLLSRY